MRRWMSRIFWVLVVLCATPLVLTIVYAPSSVHPVSTLMLKDLATFDGYDRRWVRLEDMGTLVVDSVVMSEDGQFCRHDGIDWGEFRVVLQDALAGEATRGASTIPMQTVKNLFLWGSRSHIRKAIERYVVYPGQATSYMIGKLKIMELRGRAQAELGGRFDIRGFHDVVLLSGPVPLDILEENVEGWIADVKARPEPVMGQ